MKLKVLSSSSRGNCYILEGSTQSLLLECGVGFKQILEGIDFDLSRVAGCLLTHNHGDHACSAYWAVSNGLSVFSSAGTLNSFNFKHHRLIPVTPLKRFHVGEFEVIAFPVEHDAPEPFGFLIRHREAGLILFMTDTIFTKYTFDNVNHYIVEANYALDIIDENIFTGKSNKFVRDRVLNSHMGLDTCKEFLQKCDLKKTQNIVLIHLSENNADPERFKREVEECTGKPVSIATRGSEFNLSLTKF